MNWMLEILPCMGHKPLQYTTEQRVRNRFESKFSKTRAILFAKITLEGCLWPSKLPVPVSPSGIAAYVCFQIHFLLMVLFSVRVSAQY